MTLATLNGRLDRLERGGRAARCPACRDRPATGQAACAWYDGTTAPAVNAHPCPACGWAPVVLAVAWDHDFYAGRAGR